MENKEIEMGFGPVPGKVFVFVGQGPHQSVWYKFDSDANEKIAIPHRALTGYLTNLRIVPKLFKDKVSYKLDVHISADEQYVVRSGVDTYFSQGLVHNLLMVDDFDEPLTFIAKPGNTDKIVFNSLMDPRTKTYYYFDGEKQEKLSPLVFQLQEKMGVEVQSKESIMTDLQKLQNSNTKPEPEMSGPDKTEDDDLEAF